MNQPPSFGDESNPSHVWKLHKALYGIKRAWYNYIKTYLCSIGFVRSKYDKLLFIFSKTDAYCMLLVYVGDLILTVNSNIMISNVINMLGDWFSIKDLGALHYFILVEVTPTSSGLFLSQHNFI